MALSRPTIISLIFAALFVAATSPAFGRTIMTPEFSRDENRPKVLALLPPRAEVVEGKLTSTNQLVNESAILEDITATIVETILTNKGYEVQRLTNQQINAKPELKNLVRRMNKRYDQEWQKMQYQTRKVRSRRYSCGAVAVVLANKLNVDGLLMVRIKAAKVSFGAALFAGKRGFTHLDVSVIAADTGDLEAFSTGDIPFPGESLLAEPRTAMEKVSKKAFKKFPKNGQIIIVSKRYPQHTRKKNNLQAMSDEDLLAEFESLLGDDVDEGVVSKAGAASDNMGSTDTTTGATAVDSDTDPAPGDVTVETGSGDGT